MSFASKPKAKTFEEMTVLRWWRELFPNDERPISVLHGDVDGFYGGHFKTEDFQGILVVLPDSSERHTDDEAISRLMNAVERILEICIGDLSHVDKKRVVLVLANRTNYFGDSYYYSGKSKEDLTPRLTALMNSRSIKKDTSLEYTGISSGYGTYLFELPYKGSTSDVDFTCGKYVKVDLNNTVMQSVEAKRFLMRLGNDLSVCRGQPYMNELTRAPRTNAILYLMFRNKVSIDTDWWKDLDNVANICAAILAVFQPEDGTMILEYICSRPGTTGTVSKMIKNISKDARDNYGLDYLLLQPASAELERLYQRPEYGFEPEFEIDDRYMGKYLTGPKAESLDADAEVAGGKKKTSGRRIKKIKSSI